MAENVLTIRGAEKRFGETRALDGANLELREGEWLALLGPNGAGKTTLVRSVAGRVRLDAGTIDAPTDGLGVVPQEIALYPLLTARENLTVFGTLSGVGRGEIRSRVDWALQWTGLEGRSNEPVKRFSGGMQRRLNIACGVLHRPGVLLLDEPTVGVDPQSRQRIREMLAELHADGASILLTTHQLDEAQEVAERIAIIDHGKDIAAGTFDELLAGTVGMRRRVVMRLTDDRVVERAVEDVMAELPALLDGIASDGDTVADLRIEAPSLQAVFLHLTGRELRE
jgi:ABC-2 type transport system ATP-binding protein